MPPSGREAAQVHPSVCPTPLPSPCPRQHRFRLAAHCVGASGRSVLGAFRGRATAACLYNSQILKEQVAIVPKPDKEGIHFSRIGPNSRETFADAIVPNDHRLGDLDSEA
jgi:hypothetical protein